jgi:hypothetical protein
MALNMTLVPRPNCPPRLPDCKHLAMAELHYFEPVMSSGTAEPLEGIVHEHLPAFKLRLLPVLHTREAPDRIVGRERPITGQNTAPVSR